MQNRLKNFTKQMARVLSGFLVMSMAMQAIGFTSGSAVVQAAEATPDNGYLDHVIFGNTASESAHVFDGDDTSVITGLFGETARISNPKVPAEGTGGDLTFTMKVDPYLRNYFTLKFSGEESSSVTMVNISGEQVGYVSNGDYETINKGWMLPNRFLYNTIMLPLESTYGKETVEITIRSLNPWGNMTASSRGYYKAYTHTQAYINVDGEKQGYKLKPGQTPDTMVVPDLTDAEKQTLVDTYMQDQVNLFNSLSSKVDGSAGGKMSIIRYQDELMFYASALKYSWSPAKTPEQKKAALERIFKTIDNHVKDYYGNTRLVLRGGHQGDWGGYYGALGEALYIAESLIKDDALYGEEAFNAYLDQPFVTGTVEGEFSLAGVDWNGEELTRREAWERVLKANFDFARTRLSYIYNQVYYTYVGAWEAHEGLRMIDSSFYEGPERSQQILLESLGIQPFLGEEVLVGPDGEELDLYHSLFLHDGSAVFTDDFTHIVGKGLAKSKLDENGNVVRRLPYGEHFTGLTEAGLTRENGFVANYGEAANYLVTYYYKTLGHAGEEEMNDEILKAALRSIHARGFVRYTMLDGNGKRVMVTEAVTDERNSGLPGFAAYGGRIGLGMGLQFASLEKAMADNEERYNGPEWDDYWHYAREAVGFVQQQLADRQLMHTKDFGHRGSMSGMDYRLKETYNYVTADRANYERYGGSVMAGVVMPQTDFDYYTPEEIAALVVNPEDYEQLAFADIDNIYVSLRDGDFRMFGTMFYKNRGVTSNGRLHVMTDQYDRVVQIATNNIFQYEDYYLRADNIDWDFQSNRGNNWGSPQVLVGEPSPISYQPGVGEVNRENFEADTPYSGYPELSTSRYGQYLIIFNTTRDDYGNERTFDVELPADFAASTVLDLVSGEHVPVVNGKVAIASKTAMVLKLTSAIEVAPKPSHVDFVHAVAGNGYAGISWKLTSGGDSYIVKRSDTENGEYTTIATGVTGNYYKDTEVDNGNVYYYKVIAVNEHGEGWESWRAKLDLTAPASNIADAAWRDDRIGGTSGSAAINGSTITITGASGIGLGEGDDYKVAERDIIDSLHFVNQATFGNSSISAKLDSTSGAASGLMLRDRLSADKSRYVYFGADENGELVLQTRTRNSFHHWWDVTASPFNANIEGYTAAEYPYVKLMRDHDSQTVYAFVSKDGGNWTYVTKLSVLLPHTYYTGVVASDSAQFSEVAVLEIAKGSLSPFIVKEKEQVTLHWNKPKQASWFNVYRTYDEEAGKSDPEFKLGTTELEEDSPWEEAVIGTAALSYQQSGFRYGGVHYKVMAVHGDGALQPLSGTVSVYTEAIETVLEEAEGLPAADYTKLSYHLFLEELERVKTEMTNSAADEEALINAIYDAKNLLVSVRTLLAKIEVEPSMARASERFWQNDSITEEQNAWYLFDGDPNTIAHTRSATSWVDIEFGENNEQVIDTFRYLPRRTHVNRVNGTIFRGSNDGENWTDLYKIPNTTAYDWHSGVNTDETPYRYIRIYDNHSGYVNFEEIEFLVIPTDKTLLGYLLDESAAALESGIYTEESLQALEQELAGATAVYNNLKATQEETDAADNLLLAVLDELEYIEGVPVFKTLTDQDVVAEQPLSFKVEAVNADEIVYGVQGLPSGATFDADTQAFAWTPAKEQGGIHTVTFTAASGDLVSSRSVKITVKGQPIIGSDTTVDALAKTAFAYEVAASDPSGSALVYSAENLPAGAVFDASKGILAWTPKQSDLGLYPVMFTVSNGSFSVSQTVNVNVKLNLLSAEDYSKGSHYLYMKEAVRIEAAMHEPGADKMLLAAQLDQAERALVHSSLYGFEGSADNTIGTKHGIVEGLDVYAEGKLGLALQLDGKDNFVTLPSNHPLAASDSITIAAWLNWKGGGQWQRIFDFGNNTNQYMFLTPRSGNNTLRFAIKNGGGEQMVETAQLAENQWVHVAVTLGGGTAKLYVDGELKSTNDKMTLKPSDFRPSVNYIGKSMFSADELFGGMIDEFRIYNYALSAEDVQAAMNDTGALPVDNTLIPILLGEASAIDIELYTEESQLALQEASAQAESVFGNPEATQAEIDASVATLLGVLRGLEVKGVSATFVPAVPNGKNGWYTSEVIVTLSPEAIAEYSLNGGAWTAYSTPVVITEEGMHQLQFRSSGLTGEVGSLEVKVDKTAPVVTIAGENVYTITQDILISCSTADTVSGVIGAPCAESLLQSSGDLLGLGEHSVTVTAEDEAGNQSTVTHTFTVRESYDVTELTAAIDAAQAIHDEAVEGETDGSYPVGSKAELLAAISAAIAVRDNTESTQAQVDEALASLNTAVSAFEAKRIVINRAELETAIAAAQAKHDAAVEDGQISNYPAGSKAELQAAIDAAAAVKDNAAATQAEIEAAVASLNEAVAAFDAKVISVNRIELESAITTVQAKHDAAVEGGQIGNYPAGSKAELQKAIDSAKAVRDDEASTQTAVDAAITALNAAVIAFENKKIVYIELPDYSGGGVSQPVQETYDADIILGEGRTEGIQVRRTTDSNGRVSDTIDLADILVEQAVKRLKANGASQLVISIPASRKAYNELVIGLPASAAAQFVSGGISFVIQTPDAEMSLPAASFEGMDEAMKFTITPVWNTEDRLGIEQRANNDTAVQEITGGGKVTVIGQPLDIETNLQQRKVTLMLPLPDDADLENTGVYIEHSDGTRELVKGRIVESNNESNTRYIVFEVNKFSTFAIVHVTGWSEHEDSQTLQLLNMPYMSGYDGGLFKPQASLTRAQMATILDRIIEGMNETDAMLSFTDVAASHWASEAIARIAGFGFMNGYPDGTFRPDKPITRAEMAAILSLLPVQTGEDAQEAENFSDTAEHWAQAAIAKARAAGLLNGYHDGSFRPEQSLTRAEAVTIINKLIGRQSTETEEPMFIDVPATHWAFEDIQAAAVKSSATNQ